MRPFPALIGLCLALTANGSLAGPILDAMISGPDAPLSDFAEARVPVIENPGPQKDIRATLVTSEERSPVGTEHEMYRRAIQTLEPRARKSVDQPLRRGAPDYLYSWEAKNDATLYLRRWREGNEAHLLVARVGMSGEDGIHLTMPLGPNHFSGSDGDDFFDDFYVAETPDGSVLLSLDTSRRCDGPRRVGVMLRLSPDLDRLLWTSPIRVAGGRHFGFDDSHVYAIDGGSCEPDYLYQLDIATGRVTGRNRVPSAQDAGDYTALEGQDLYLVLYNRFMHYRLR